MGRVLVTGASGFIGRHTLAPLRAAGLEVHAVGRRQIAAAGGDGVVWHTVDLLDAASRGGLLRDVAPSHLLHLAWYAEPGRFWMAPENLAWAEASLGLFRDFAACGGSRAVFAGTCAEYDWSGGVCREDATPLRPTTLYGACKLAVAAAVTAPDAGPSTAWGRVFFLYGPGEPRAKLVASVIDALLDGRRAPVSHGRQVRDFLHVADVAGAFAALVADEDVRGAVNVASGLPVSLRELLSLVEERLDARGLVAYGERPAAPGEPPVILGDVARLHDELGFTPEHTLESGLDDAIAHLRSAA